MSRARQRANRRIKVQAQKLGIDSPEFIHSKERRVDKPWLNAEGYADPTAYQAIRSIRHRERAVAEHRQFS